MGMMETTEKEVQTLEQLYALRKQAVRLHKSGMRVMQIVTATGLSWPGVRMALKLYEQGGMAALKPAPCAARNRGPVEACQRNRNRPSDVSSATRARSS